MLSWASRHAGVVSGVLTGAAVFAVALGALEIRAYLRGPKAVPAGKSTLFVLSSDAWVPQAVEAITDEDGKLAEVRIGRRRFSTAQVRDGIVLAQSNVRELAGVSARPLIRLQGSRDFNEAGGVLSLVLARDSNLIPSDERILRLSVRAENGAWQAYVNEGEPAAFEQLHIEALRSYDTDPDSLSSGTGSGQARGAKIITVVRQGKALAHYNTVHLEMN